MCNRASPKLRNREHEIAPGGQHPAGPAAGTATLDKIAGQAGAFCPGRSTRRLAHQQKDLTMSLIVPIDTAPEFAPREDVAAPDRLIEGAPAFRTWAQDEAWAEAAQWGQIRTGVWEATPGTTKSMKGETFEFCHILSGRVEISEDGGDTFSFGAGDSFVMKPGFVGQWKTLETLRKIYVTATPVTE